MTDLDSVAKLITFLDEHPDAMLEIRGTKTPLTHRIGRTTLRHALAEKHTAPRDPEPILLTANLTQPPPCTVCGAADHGCVRFNSVDIVCPAQLTIAGQPLVEGRFPDGSYVERRDGSRYVVVMPLVGGPKRAALKTQGGFSMSATVREPSPGEVECWAEDEQRRARLTGQTHEGED